MKLRGLKLKPNRKWDGDPNFKFRVHGRSDSTYALDQTMMRSVTGSTVFLEGAPCAMKCFQQVNVTLSSAEAELMAAVTCAQDMLYVMRLLESIGLQIEGCISYCFEFLKPILKKPINVCKIELYTCKQNPTTGEKQKSVYRSSTLECKNCRLQPQDLVVPELSAGFSNPCRDFK